MAGYAAQKIHVAPLKDFLCYADLQSLARRNVRAAACFHADANAPRREPASAHAVCRYDLSRENAMPGGPQTARHCSIINNSSADATATTAACGQRLSPAGGRCRIATKEGMQGGAVGAVAAAGCHNSSKAKRRAF